MSADETTFEQLLAGAGIDTSTEQMRWMVLTWDLAKIGPESNDFIRLFLTPGMTVLTKGTRSRQHFDALNPLTGDVRPMPSGDNPLGAAERATDRALSIGYRLLCQPLAVDCSSLARLVLLDDSRIAQPSDLMTGLLRANNAGIVVMRTINHVRLAAMETHIAPGWWDAFGLERDLLWTGRR